MSSDIALSEAAAQVKRRIRAAHIEQLRTFPLPSSEPLVPQEDPPETLNSHKHWLLECSKESNAQIQQAIAQSMFAALYCIIFRFGFMLVLSGLRGPWRVCYICS